MKHILFMIIVSTTILFSGCNGEQEGENELYIVDFEQCLDTEQMMKISEIADTIEYLELKTPRDIIITRIFNIIPADDFWFIHAQGGLFKFTKEGEYVKKIGRRGQGPGELTLMLLGIDIDFIRKEIILEDVQQLLFYDFDGNFLRNVKIDPGDYFHWNSIGISDSVLWSVSYSGHIDKYAACALTRKGDTLVAIPNPVYGMQSLNTDGIYSIISRSQKTFYRYDGTLYLRNRAEYDTIFRLSGIDRTPYIVFNMGKYKMPVEHESWYSIDAYDKNGSRYWGIPAVAEDDRYLYLSALRRRSIHENNAKSDEENRRYIVYDKQTGKGFVPKGKITDDILGAPATWPSWVTDDYYISTVEWYDLSQELKNGNYTLAPALKKQFDSFDYGTNELVVLCRRKKVKNE